MSPGSIHLEHLATALGLGLGPERCVVTLVGGGDKTTVALALAERVASTGPTVVTATVPVAPTPSFGRFPRVVGADDDTIVAAAAAGPRPLVAWERLDDATAVGLGPERVDRLSRRVTNLVVEGARSEGRPFTAPGPLEPVIPATTTHVVAGIGADAIGRCIGDQCHHPLRVAALADCGPFDRLTPTRAADVLLSERGPARGRPPTAHLTVAIIDIDDTTRDAAEALAAELSVRGVDVVQTAGPTRESSTRA